MKKLIYILLLLSISLNAQFTANIGVFASSGGVAEPTYLLDTYNSYTPTHAYSFFKLKSTATKSIEIKRLNDNVKTDVLLHDTNGLSTSSLVSAGGTLGAWLGSSDAEISKFYTQIGTNDLVTTSDIYNPLIATAGVINLDSSGNPAAYWDIGDFMEFTNLSLSATSNIYFRLETSAIQTVWFRGIGSSDYVPISQISSSDSFAPSAVGTNLTYYKDSSISIGLTRQNVKDAFHVGTSHLFSIINADLSQGDFSLMRVGRYGSGFDIDGSINEIVIFASDTSIDRTNIESEIISRY